MINFYPYWIYYVATTLSRLHEIDHDDLLSEWLAELGSINSELKRFLEVEQHGMFPDTCKQVQELVAKLDALIAQAANQARKLSNDDIGPMIEEATEIGKHLFRESSRVHIYGLERQGMLDLYILIEQIGGAFSERAKLNLSKMSIREIRESGKCLAFERYTASGFHMLRAVESEIRDYIILLTHETPKKRDWGHYIDIMKSN